MSTNPVREAMDVLGGRLEDVAVVCRCSAQAVHKWLKVGLVPSGRYAVLIARATLERGQPVSVDRLVGLPVEGTAPNGGPSLRRVRKARPPSGCSAPSTVQPTLTPVARLVGAA